MTRTTKRNDVPHNDPERAALAKEEDVPKFFGKSGFADTDPSKTKKNGGGKGNWGHEGDEIEDLNEFNLAKARRRSNSSHGAGKVFATKFEDPDPEVLEDFDEDVHGPIVDRDEDGEALSEATTESTTAGGANPGENLHS